MIGGKWTFQKFAAGRANSIPTVHFPSRTGPRYTTWHSCSSLRHANVGLLVQDDTKEGRVDVETAIVSNEAQFPDFVHEKVDSGARCANHFRQSLLRYFGDHYLRLGLLAIASEQQKSPSQPFLARIEKLIDQVLLDSDVP